METLELEPTNPNSNGGSAAKVLHINNPTDDWTVTHYTNLSTGSLAGDGMIVGNIGIDGHIFNYETGALLFGTNSMPRMKITSDGNVGIGITSPNSNGGSAAKVLHVNNPTDDWTVTHYTNLSTGSLAGDGMIVGNIGIDGHIFNYETGALLFGTNSMPRMKITSDGNVGIGTDNPKTALDVRGTIKASEIKVEAQTADFVFEEDYNLRPLDEVETFVKENKHLPEIPSARQMEAEGVNVAEMNKLLLQKVEELTLYMIQMNKDVTKLKKENTYLKKKIETL